MSSVTVLLHFAVLLALAHAAAQRATTGVCAGQLAQALTSRGITSKELLSLCSHHYSKGVCLAASRTLSEELPADRSNGASVQQWAATACGAVEAAASQQRALLLRQRGVSRDDADDISSAEKTKLADIRSDASVHRLSLDLARRYRKQAAKPGERSSLPLDHVLHQKIPIPHGRFDWETNHSNHSSAMLEKAVENWKKDHTAKIDVKRPDVVNRANAFKDFVSKGGEKSKSAAKAASFLKIGPAVVQKDPLGAGSTVTVPLPRELGEKPNVQVQVQVQMQPPAQSGPEELVSPEDSFESRANTARDAWDEKTNDIEARMDEVYFSGDDDDDLDLNIKFDKNGDVVNDI